MISKQNTQSQIHEVRCKDLLDCDEIRFAGIINEDGRLVSGGFKQGLAPLEADEE